MNLIRYSTRYMIILCVLLFNSSFAQFSFVHLSDVHISDGDSYVNNSDINGVVFSQMLSQIRDLEPQPAFVVISGDVSNIGNGLNDGMYSVLTQFLYPGPIADPGNGDYYIDQAQQIPVYFVPGNHEYYMLLTPPLSSPAIGNYTAQIAPDSDYVVHYQNAAIFMMRSGQDAFRPIWEDTNPTCPEGSGITNEQLAWLDNALLANTGLKKIIVMHHPPVNAVGTNANGSPSTGTVLDPADGSIIKNREAFLDLCENAQADMTLSGHVHQNVVASRDGSVVNENWTGGTRYIQTGACEYGNYRVITVDSNFVYAGDPQQLFPSGITSKKNPVCVLSAYFNNSQNSLIVKACDHRHIGKVVLSLYSASGAMLINRHTELIDGMETSLDVTGIAAGLYFVEMTGNDFTAAQKVVIY